MLSRPDLQDNQAMHLLVIQAETNKQKPGSYALPQTQWPERRRRPVALVNSRPHPLRHGVSSEFVRRLKGEASDK